MHSQTNKLWLARWKRHKFHVSQAKTMGYNKKRKFIVLNRLFLVFLTIYCSIGTSPMGCFSKGKPTATESCYLTSSACCFFFLTISTILKTLTWTTGCLTCLCDLFACVYTYRDQPTSVYPLIWRSLAPRKLTRSQCTKPGTKPSPIHVVNMIDCALSRLFKGECSCWALLTALIACYMSGVCHQALLAPFVCWFYTMYK